LGDENGLNINADDVDALSIDITNVDQGTATGINADTLGGVVASEYVSYTKLDTVKNEIESNISGNYALKTELNAYKNEINTNIDNITTNYALKSELPNVPLTSVNGKIGDAILTANDVGATVVRFHTLSFPASGWVEQSDGSFTQQVAVEGILETNYAHVDIDMSSATVDTFADLQDAWALINRAQSIDGGVLLTAFDGAPEVDLVVKLEVIR
jgi:hypothetical protein